MAGVDGIAILETIIAKTLKYPRVLTTNLRLRNTKTY